MVSKILITESNDASTVNDKMNENGETELHLAAAQNMRLSAMSLIKLGADVNAVCNLNETPLHKAIKNDHSIMVHFLLENGADLYSKNKNGETPVYIAVKLNHKACLNILLENGANVNHIQNILPPEMVEKILKLLNLREICRAQLVCKRWKEIIDKGNLVKKASGKTFTN